MTEGQSRASPTNSATPQEVLAALGEVIRAVSSSGFDLDGVLETIIRHAVERPGRTSGIAVIVRR